MDSERAIVVDHVSKSFKIYKDRSNTMMETLLFRKRQKYDNRQVLNDISFIVNKGEAVGLIGSNGCGKSTTLKMLSRILYPDKGTIQINGRVSSLIELGAGFHPDMSGRENIYINASVFGLTKKEIDSRLDDIIEFSELEEFIDNPVRTYSSGMYMRLAFSVAINVDADILLIDEILAVGDVNFQGKCFNRLKEIKAEGTTIVIVSHSMGQIEQICDKSIWIHEGKIRAEGLPREIDPQYLDCMGEHRQKAAEKQEKRSEEKNSENNEIKKEKDEKVKTRWGNGDARISKIRLLNKDGNETSSFCTDEPMTIQLDYVVNKRVDNAVVGIGIFRIDGLQCYGTNTRIDRLPEFSLTENGSINVILESMNLLPGSYTLDLALEKGIGVPIDYFTKAKKFEVYTRLEDVGVTRIRHRWEIG